MSASTDLRWAVDNTPSQRWPIYTRGNVGEVFPDVVTPLGWSILGRIAEYAWRDAYAALGISRSADFTQDMEILGVFNGYCYLNASILRVSGVRAPGGTPEAVDQQLIGDSSAPPYEERRGDKALWCRARMFRTVRKMLRESGLPDLAAEANEVATSHLRQRPPLESPDDVLRSYIDTAFSDDFGRLFSSHINLTTQSTLLAGYLSWLCLRAGDLGLLVGLSTDLGGVQSAEPGEDMWRISRQVRASAAVTEVFDAGSKELESRLRSCPEAGEVLSAFDDFLAKHGHRGPNEWELASRTWSSHPNIALVAIDRMRLADDERGPEHQRERAAKTRNQAEAEMRDNLSPIDRRNLTMVLSASAAMARGREMTRNQNVVVVNSAREVLYELARRAKSRGGAEPTDAFMLDWANFKAYLNDPAPHLTLIAERAELRRKLDLVDPPFVVVGDPGDLSGLLARKPKDVTIVPAGTELQGNAGSPGIARGRARVVMDPAEPGELADGDIMIAPLTDPSWTPLFLAASGVVVDVGATVSHAVVVSRELCIPCVVGVHDATQIIPDGALVEIDGSAGVVRVIEHPDSGPPADIPAEQPPTRAPVVAFTDQLDLSWEARVALLGGKGANLVEMVQKLDLPVPPGFVITTDVCRSYLAGEWPESLDACIEDSIGQLGQQLDRRLGDPERALLVSVRSGAPVSMPGMMDTILNVGMNPTIRDGLAAETGDSDFAARTWLRFCQMYAEIVLGMDRRDIEAVVGEPQGFDETNRAAEHLRAAAEPEGGIPNEPRAQVRAAIEAVFKSWNTPRAGVFRSTEGIDDAMGTAVTVQAMVFGNLDQNSGTGVAFTRDPATGTHQLYGDYLPRAQGEDVVAGTHEVLHLDALATHAPEVHSELCAIGDRLERHYRDMCDIEFTVSNGVLHVLQVRVGRRSPEAAVRIAVQMAEDPNFPLTRSEAVARIDRSALEALANRAEVRPDIRPLATGIAASPGVAAGTLSVDPNQAADLALAGERVILVRAETSPADVHGMVGAAGLVTSLGGAVSHAAVVARSWAIPAVTGARDIEVLDDGIRVGGRVINVGQQLTVDGGGGRVFEGDQLADRGPDLPELDVLRRWAMDLGLEIGEPSPVQNRATGSARREVSTFEVVRAAQLKGVATADVLAAALDTDPDSVTALAADHLKLLQTDTRGVRLTVEGRSWLDEQLAAERTQLEGSTISGLYSEFLVLNREFKTLVTDWQASDQDADALSATVEDLNALDARFAPVLHSGSELVTRLAPYANRFAVALGALNDGDVTMLASPLKDSYHTVWFEYHEELIHLTGRNRLEEEQGESP